jgi:tetratricopeptide (TPR) repeat protein
MVQTDGRPVVMDFGLARRIDRIETQLTTAGAIVGTPAYMAPEQVRAEVEKIGPATDVYALGVIMYQLLTERLPFEGKFSRVMNQILNHSPAPPSRHRTGIDTRLDAICMKAMSRRIEDRYQTMDELNQAITAFLRQPSSSGWTSGTSSEAEVVVDVIRLLDQFGWTKGLTEINDLADAAEGTRRGEILAALIDWFKDIEPVSRERAERWEASELHPWRFVGLAFDALHRRNYRKAELMLRRAEECQVESHALRASIDHCYGLVAGHQGDLLASVPRLHRALETSGHGHFLEGRILDSLGKAYASLNHFAAAREFYEHAIQAKRAWQDESGLAVTHGQLGRLFLDWGDLDTAEQHFRMDLELAERREHLRAMCLMFNHLGRVYLMRQLPEEALGYFDESLYLAVENRYPIEEGFTRKDIALAMLETGDTADIEQQLDAAESIFKKRNFDEGIAHVRWVRGLAAADDGDHRQAERMLRGAISVFEATEEVSLVAQCWRDLAAVREARGASPRLVADALLIALQRAEQSRREWLVEQVEGELQRVAPVEHLRHAQRQSRGCDRAGAGGDITPLDSTVLSLEILNPTSLIRSHVSATGYAAINQLFFEVSPVMERFGITPFQYRYDGFDAVCRGARHARAAVRGGLQLRSAIEEFNRPRRVLELPEVHVSIRISSGKTSDANLGTYRKSDFVAAGMPAKIASRLPALPDVVLICHETYILAKDHFTFDAGSPYTVELAGTGIRQYWIVDNAVEDFSSRIEQSTGDQSTS